MPFVREQSGGTALEVYTAQDQVLTLNITKSGKVGYSLINSRLTVFGVYLYLNNTLIASLPKNGSANYASGVISVNAGDTLIATSTTDKTGTLGRYESAVLAYSY